MCQLTAHGRALCLAQLDNAVHRFDLRIVPKTQVMHADSPARLDGGCLGDDQANAARCARGEMRQVPIGRQTVFSG